MKMTVQGLQKAKQLYIGMLSGTSMNSIDAVLVNFINNNCCILGTASHKVSSRLIKQILTVIHSGSFSVIDFGMIDCRLGLAFVKCVEKLLHNVNGLKITAQDIAAIGFHGQTIWHEPWGRYPFTLQLGDPNIICTSSNIITISDFRRKDLALGGQGAPLAPGFHAAFFSNKEKNRAIINIGGISNITVLPKKNGKNYNKKILGFDLGPGNCLMDEWTQSNFKINYDKNGLLASKGTVIQRLLKSCLEDPYFKKAPPKSTGREYFNQNWLAKKIQQAKLDGGYSNEDFLATLLQLTANLISNQVNNICIEKDFKQRIEEVYICGGGANNKALLALLKKQINCPVTTTAALGIHQELVEAALFAWLAKQTLEGYPGNIPSVTGATKSSVLGAIYIP